MIWKYIEGMLSWATVPLVIFILGRLPLYVAGKYARDVLLVQNAPFTLEWLMRFAMIGIFLSAILSLALLRPIPGREARRKLAVMLLQWLLLPVTLVFFGSIPSIDAQTRLMLGKYMGFNVTKKTRKENAESSKLSA